MINMPLRLGSLISILGILAVSSCQSRGEAGISEYLKYLEGNWNKITDSKELNGIEYSIRFLPTDFRILKRYGRQLSPEELNRERQVLMKFQYFQLSLKSTSGEPLSFGEIGDGVTSESRGYLQKELANNTSLISRSDTLHSRAHQLISKSGNSSLMSILIAFQTTGEEDKQIVIDDCIFHNGQIVLEVDGLDIGRIPQLTLDKS